MIKNKMIDYFGIITDQRQKAKIKHKLTDILFIPVVGTLANCDSWVAIEDFANDRSSFFKKYLSLSYGIPSHDTMQRVFEWIDPKEFQNTFRTRKEHSPDNLSLLRKFALNILRNIETERAMSGPRKRAKAMTDEAFLELVVKNTFLA